MSFGIITEAGTAKSSAMKGIYAAKEGDFEEADKFISDANKQIDAASHIHMDVITEEAKGSQLDFKVLFMHAEDQLLSTQTLILLAKEIVDLYKKIK